MDTFGYVLDQLSLSTLRYHWQTVLSSAFMFAIIYEVSRIFSPVLFPKTFQFFKGYNAPNWHVHVVSTVHCLLVVTGSFFIFADNTLHQDRVFGYVRWAADIYSISCGYFLWDTIIAIYFYKYQGISMVIHGIASFSVFIFSFRPFINYYGAVFLMYEISTIFLNFHWFMDKLGWTGSKIQLVNGIVLLLTFFGARVVFGPYMSYKLWNDIYAVKEDVPLRYWIVYGVANVATTCLNFWWFSQMVAMLRKRFPGQQEVAKQK
ncbi:putative TLC domain-containing protein C17A2.02c [Choanephora cucurbitarum]|uniref:Putative TLC domain-containing protein C17A2.02c n=1 Tax=Choanephora cucurbitarum TaxID=101091 RepID=A0A1C7NN03_9FUNG|nr:putative TLC domain-containing protein C17A2.02c [Choanephora cucurbitarum]